jgi:Tfp pilus assembly protein PilF
MYQRALALDPSYVKARNNLASTYLRLTMDEHARTELHKALEADDTYGLAHYNLACVYARAGDSSMAAQHLQRAIALEPQARVWAQTDDDFARVRATSVVQQLLGP